MKDIRRRAVENLNTRWYLDDIICAMKDAGIPTSEGNIDRLCNALGRGFNEELIRETNERLHCLVEEVFE